MDVNYVFYGNINYVKKSLTIPFPLRTKLYRIKSHININLLRKVFNNKYPNRTLQTRLINRRKFKYLIVLDACRFDFFEEYIYRFLDGILYSVLSPANETLSWLKRTWYKQRYTDIIYFSSNVFINSKKCYHGFCGHKKFLKVVDLWRIAWDERLLTVPPWNVNKYVKIWSRLNKKHKKTHRFVIHYIQPHYPYISLNQDIIRKVYSISNELNITAEDAFLIVLCSYIKSKDKIWELIRRLYRENLKIVLKHVADLVTELEKPIIITADHGELLGEYELFSHPNIAHPVIRIVPWFIVK
ncbi:MAG: hypothetical protein J7L82_05525 [Staphylothermus sp.]|nr:hypothetical protein [Staphylothermus sp.]